MLFLDHISPNQLNTWSTHLNHASDGLPGLAEVEEVVVGEVPLPVGRRAVEDCDAPVRQRGQNAALHVAENVFKV